jgi:hypothetical protein
VLTIVVSLVSVGWVLPTVYVPPDWVRYANIARCFKILGFFRSISSEFAFVFNGTRPPPTTPGHRAWLARAILIVRRSASR